MAEERMEKIDFKEKFAEIKNKCGEFFKSLKKFNLKIIIPSGLCLILLLYFVITFTGSFSHKEEPDPEVYKICTYTGKQTLEAVDAEERAEAVTIRDFNYYGESLNLYFQNYELGMSTVDTMKGQSVVLVDMCTGEKTIMKCSEKVDSQIDLGQLKAGFYAVYLQSGETMKRICFESKQFEDTTFYTVTRNSQRAKVQLIADKALFNEENATENRLDKDYLYIKVDFENVSENTTVYDVVITTAPSLTANASAVGAKANGITEAEELFDVAEQIKAELEAAGLKVDILKDSYNEQVWYYGEDSVLQRAYQSRAKYMLNLDMLGANSYSAPDVYYSEYTEGRLASAIVQQINATQVLELKAVSSGLTKDNFDDTFEIREAGGLVLGAGRYSASSQKNASFAEENRYGINTVLIVYINIDKANAVNSFTSNKAALAKATAQGVLDCLHIEK